MGTGTDKLGILCAAGAYILWGFLPLYWKLVEHISALEVLAHRIVWAFVFMMIIVVISKQWNVFKLECLSIIKDRNKLFGITAASLVISINWLVYIWAVNNNHVVEASLGYYVNPLVSILLGVLVLKEQLNKWQIGAFILATIGVLNMTIHFGSIPWVALLLAISFGLYGLLKKLVSVNSVFGLTIETLIVTPIALLFLSTVHSNGTGGFQLSTDPVVALLLVGTGMATAIPLLLFASGAKRIPLSMVGFLQYFAPTIMLILGVLLFKEPFTTVHMISFTFIWSALTIYTLSRTKLLTKLEGRRSINKPM
ncbi:EamA family transporter RarD [Salirhabdus salicampi]|uniref:EamA family transporter RarD n=1 Tax=Salirhabdus salicampi TaxID=476102 RepID=UPI0020C33F7E|nr:EamA family transporter RarD [Salirhabdus salicampi]MCP8617353.1 EamA family transporter RarD [Salirhabdus salicampi]